MATRTESLKGVLSVDDAQWKAGLAKATALFKTFSTGIGRQLAAGMDGGVSALKGIGGAISGALGGALGTLKDIGMALGVGGLLSAGGAVAGIKNVTDLGGEISDLHSRTGIAIDDLVVLREQFRQGGLDIESATTYIKKMNEALLSDKKRSVFEDLGLKPNALLAMDPMKAFDKIISAVGKIRRLADQQDVMSDIFGKGGVEMMTLVTNKDAAAQAKRMVGAMAPILEKSAEDFDRISDNLFGGIPIKIEQAFVGFTNQLLEPLLAMTGWIEKMDFTGVGAKIGDELMWAMDLFKGLWDDGTIGAYLWNQLQDAVTKGALYFAGAMSAAWAAVFSTENLMVLKGVFGAMGGLLTAELMDAITSVRQTLPYIMGGLPGFQAKGLRENAQSIRESAMTKGENALGLGGDMVPVTMGRFAAGLSQIDPAAGAFGDRMAALQLAEESMRWNAFGGRESFVDPVTRAGGLSALAPVPAKEVEKYPWDAYGGWDAFLKETSVNSREQLDETRRIADNLEIE